MTDGEYIIETVLRAMKANPSAVLGVVTSALKFIESKGLSNEFEAFNAQFVEVVRSDMAKMKQEKASRESN